MTEMATIRATIKRARNEGVGITETGLRRLVKTGQLPCTRIGNRVYIAWPVLLRFLGVEQREKAHETA